jgi:serine protease Do
MEHKEEQTKAPQEKVEQDAKSTPEKVVTPAEVKKVEKSEPSVSVKAQKRRRNPAKTIFFLLVLLIVGGSFAWLGVYVDRSVIPAVKGWLIDHNFMQDANYSSQQREQNSPFLPQPTQGTDNGAKGGNSLTIPQVVKNVSQGVVSIAVSSSDLGNGGIEQSTDNIGTGFVVDAAAGIIVTNQHVVSDKTAAYEVVTQDNKTYIPKKIIRDDINDIAIIVVDAKELSAINLGDSDKIQVGETVIAIGTPLGDYPGSVTVGVISGLGRSVKTSGGFWEVAKEYENVIQTDAAVNPGNSGGPLINLSGEVIGVSFATTSGADNISFALPINLVKQKVAEFKQYGKFRSAYLGVGYRMVTTQEATYYDVEPGALVRSVATGSPAEKAGLKTGDIVTKINGTAVKTSLATSLSKFKVGDEITVTIYRSSRDTKAETLTIKVTLSDRPE